MTEEILILGGGTGGLVVATALSDARRKYDLDINITLINKDEWHYMPPLWKDVAVHGLPIDETRASLKNLEKYGVRVTIGEATKIDPDNRRVVLASGKELLYDYLFVTLGLRNAWEVYPGLNEEGYHNYDSEGAVELNKALTRFRGGKIVILIPEIPYRCGIYPMEIATMLGYKFHSEGIKTEITILSPRLPNNLDITYSLGPDIRRLWAKYFEKFNITVKIHDGLERIDSRRHVIVTRNFEEEYDLLIKVPPPRPPRILEDKKFLFSQDKRFVIAKPLDFRHPEYDDIFLPGEHSMPPTGLGTAGVFVHAASLRATSFLVNELGGAGEIYDIPPVACAAYVADKGWLGVCETEFDGNRYNWRKCYSVAEGFIMKLVKRGFYQAWLDRLRF